jgi:hypothetical protein
MGRERAETFLRLLAEAEPRRATARPGGTAPWRLGASPGSCCHGNSSRPGGWTLGLHPDPPRDLSWLDLTTTPGKPPGAST